MIVLCIYIYIENNVTGFLYGTKSAAIVIWLYFLVVIFHVRAASSPVSAFVFVSQIIVYTIRLNVHLCILRTVTGFLYVALQVLLVLCSIWSLDFIHSIIPSFSVSSNIKTVHALTHEYLVGI